MERTGLERIENHQAYEHSIEPMVFSQLLSEGTSDWKIRRMIRELYQTVFENIENGITHNPYSHEAREVECIRLGDAEGLRRVLRERFPERYGKLADDALRQEINMGIVSVTLASRAAIESGLHYEIAFYLSDISIQRLNKCQSAMEALELAGGVEMLYAELVHDLQKNGGGEVPRQNRHISRCKDYIVAHLHEKLTIHDIAKAVGLEANYLSVLFQRCENVSLKQYILNEKVRMVKSQLVYSNFSYSQIAANLGFSSQSHMGTIFKKTTGMTPRAYRNAHSNDDFVRESMGEALPSAPF